MTKLHVKRWTLIYSDGEKWDGESDYVLLDRAVRAFYLYNDRRHYSIRDNHAEIEKLAEKAKNN